MAITPFPKRVKVKGGTINFPPICPHCLQPATTTVSIQSTRTLTGYYDAYIRRKFSTIRVPFCARFARKHRIAKMVWSAGAVLALVFILVFLTANKTEVLFLFLLFAGPAWIPLWVLRPEKYVQLLPATGDSVELGVDSER